MWLFADWDLAPQFFGEVFEEDHLALRLLSFRCLDWHYGNDALAVGREIDVKDAPADLLLRSQPRLVGHKGIALHRIGRHHDVAIQCLEKQLVPVVHPNLNRSNGRLLTSFLP